MEQIHTILFILVGIYLSVMIMIFTDLWSGVRKAKRLGEARTSYGYKRTVSKFAQYYNMLIALSVIDAMQMSAVWFLQEYHHTSFWLFPFFTLFGALFLSFIEVKSIYEKAEDKVRLDKAGEVVGRIIQNRKDVEEIISLVSAYMKSESSEEKSGNQSSQKYEL